MIYPSYLKMQLLMKGAVSLKIPSYIYLLAPSIESKLCEFKPWQMLVIFHFKVEREIKLEKELLYHLNF